MVSFDFEGLRFHLRAAAVIVEDDRVLLHRLEGDPVWALPGGRVNPGEAAATAVARELEEETGQAVEVDDLLFVVENFFTADATAHHEVGLYFRAQLPASSRLRDFSCSHAGIEGGARLEYRWFRRTELGQVDLRPGFLRRALAEPLVGVKHRVQRGEQTVPG
jgi:ADP-ribose pyrophosphatase YjhB (NUDIX family)